MMTYNAVKAAIFASATVPDGYFGARQMVGLAIADNHVMCVTDSGYYRSGMVASSPGEALYYLKNHPLHHRHDNITLID